MDPIPNLKQTEYELKVPSHFIHANAGDGKPLLVMIHGYMDSASSFVRRAFDQLDPRFETIAPNGPFPLPQRVDGEWKEAFGWYFADFARNHVLIHPFVAANAVKSLIDHLGLTDRAKILCGFSQGGYFLPHLTHKLKNVRQLIGVGTGYRHEVFAKYDLRLPVTAIHGDADEIIAYAEARSDFEKLGQHNTDGEFIGVPKMTHSINDAGRAAIKKILDSATKI